MSSPPGPSVETGALFCSPEYLQPLSESGCAVPATGWTPVPLAAGVPCYEKTHSWGEFVFDQAFARAYEQRGHSYYPKLVCCVPFTPVPGPRLRTVAYAEKLLELMREQRASSAHVLFLPESEAQMLAQQGWLRREQSRYAWHNAGYGGFEDFLGALNSKRRKNIRSERRRLADSRLRIEWREGAELSAAEWGTVVALYQGTYAERGMPSYLSLACLKAWAHNFGARMQFCLALDGEVIVAMALYFRDGPTLCGRHWGASVAVPGLHFELCVYQGIEFCIRERLRRFDAGVQGEHKLLRGFAPEISVSMHWFADEGFRRAIADYLGRERLAVAREVDELSEHAGYRVNDSSAAS